MVTETSHRLFFLLSIYLLSISGAMAANNSGEELLDKVVEWCKQKNSIEVTYTLTAGGESVSGTMIVNGKRFVVKSAILDTWFDGKTQWTYNPSTNETTITEPTEEELQQVNPFIIIDAFRHNYNISLMDEQEASKINMLRLTPKDPSADIRQIEIAIPKGVLYPVRIVLRMANGEMCTLSMSRFIRGVNYNNTTFKYDVSTHPTAKVIDMR